MFQLVFGISPRVLASINAQTARIAQNISMWPKLQHWAKIGKCSEENPELTYGLIKDILIGVEELEQGESSEYEFG